jgi:CheY-like chemotaxis protein
MPPEIKKEVVLPVSVGKSATFLIAEDEDLNFMLVSELLRGFNLEIIRAVNGEEAVQIAISNNKIDLILMDLKMPVMDGYEATKAIKAYNPSIPVIALTAYSLESDRNKALTCGCFEVIVKPVDKEDFYSKLGGFLKKRTE